MAPGQSIRVCHVSMCLQTGGLERLLVDFARFHDRKKFELQFLALAGDGQPADDIRAEGCTARVLNDSLKIRKFRSIALLVQRLKQRRTQIVHTHNTYAQFYGTLAAKLAGVPIVINTQHGGWLELMSIVVDELVSQAATLGRMMPSWNLVSLATSMRCIAASSVRQW